MRKNNSLIREKKRGFNNMNIEAQKIRFERIDECFSILKRNRRKPDVLHNIERNLSEVFDQSFKITIIETKRTDPCFVMSVFPELETIDKIIESIVKEESTGIIHELWEKNTSWNIEIDRRVLDDTIVPISSRECTALLLHEVGHTLHSNSIPNRIARVLKYEFANMNTSIKMVMKSDKFRNILSLPIVDSCTMSSKVSNDGIRKEIAADNYVKNLGYGMELSSVLDKFSGNVTHDPDKSMKTVTNFSVDVIENFKQRKAKLNQRNFDKLIMVTPSYFVNNVLKDIRTAYTEGSLETSMGDTEYMNYICESVNDIIDNYYTEFFFSKKKLKKLDPYDIDYISVEIDKIKSHDDKLLILSYIRSKIDTVQYYIDILLSDKYSKKYEVPHTMEYLTSYKSKLEMLSMQAMKKKIEPKDYSIKIKYPVGYEG